MESEEAVNEARLRALFPDYHSSFNDIVRDSDAAGEEEATGEENVDEDGNASAKALGHLSDKQLSVLVARHARIFLSLTARTRRAVQAMSRGLVSASPARPNADEIHAVSDAERLVAFGDSYRASVLLADTTSQLSAVIVEKPTARHGTDGEEAVCDGDASTVLHLEKAFVSSHILALSDASRLCKSGRSLLDDAAEDGTKGLPGGKSSGRKKKSGKVGGAAVIASGRAGGAGWSGEGAAGRSLCLVDSFRNFHLDPNVGETRLADCPLAGVLRRVAGLLSEFPGHGVLIQVWDDSSNDHFVVLYLARVPYNCRCSLLFDEIPRSRRRLLKLYSQTFWLVVSTPIIAGGQPRALILVMT